MHTEAKPIDQKERMRVLYAYALLLFAAALLTDSPRGIAEGLWRILLHPSNLMTDYMQLGSMGAAFFNAGLMTLLGLFLLRRTRVPLSGLFMASVFTLSGFSLFGKNLLNSLAITLGVEAYCGFAKEPFGKQLHVAFFGTALGPLVSTIAFEFNLPLWKGLLYGNLAGFVVGFFLPPLAANFRNFHHGYCLYNVGFTAGIVGMLAVGAFRYMNWEIVNQSIVYEGSGLVPALFCLLLFGGMLAWGLALARGNRRRFKYLLRSTGRVPSDYLERYGFGNTLINMALLGFLSLGYALLVGSPLNGPVLGAILTVVGFGAYGKQLRNVLPVLIGVLLLNLFSGFEGSPTTMVVSGLFGTTLAPLAGHFGFLPGVLAGFTHMTVVMNVGILHSGVNLYNNGFAGGFVAAFMVPLMELLEGRRCLPKHLWHRLRGSEEQLEEEGQPPA